MSPARCLQITLVACALAACGSSEPATAPLAAHTATPGPLPPAGRGGPAGARTVAFRAGDGVGLRGRLFGGDREAAVVLVHMGNGASNEADWYGLARRLAREGYMVLTYNRRGVCSGEKTYDCSAGLDDWAKTGQDVVGAVRCGARRAAARLTYGTSKIDRPEALGRDPESVRAVTTPVRRGYERT